MNKDFQILKNLTSNAALVWKECRGIAPNAVADKMDDAMLNWMVQLTDCLEIWMQRGLQMTEGELILAHTNIGSLVESWLRFFYCVFFEDYQRDQQQQRGRGVRPIGDPEQVRFVELQNFSEGRLWDVGSPWGQWVDTIRQRRNGVHSFLFRELGTAQDFLDDVDKLLDFVRLITSRLPPIEDFLGDYPEGYILYPEDPDRNLFPQHYVF